MQHVRFKGTLAELKGDFDELVPYADKAGAVGIVTQVREGLEAIDAATYRAEKAAILAHNAALPAPTPAVDTALAAIAEIVAKDDSAITAGEVKTLIVFIARRLLRRGALR